MKELIIGLTYCKNRCDGSVAVLRDSEVSCRNSGIWGNSRVTEVL